MMDDAADNYYALASGTRLDEYKILSVLGQGSFGITYLAEDVNLGTRVALKEYLPSDWAVRDSTKSVRPKSTSAREGFKWGVDAFLKEARILASVEHPNIVKVRRFLRANGTAYIVMDFVEGRPLGDILGQDYPSGGFPGQRLEPMVVALLDGLAAVHKAGVVHRDIKPANILIAPDDRPILIDFGAARNVQRTLRSGMTVIMTPGYAPIEQYTEDGEQGAWSDIYSLGAVAYRAISGKAPMEPYKRISGGVQPSASSLGAGKYSPALLSAVDWAISVHPKDRPQSVAALTASLRSDDSDATRVVVSSHHRPLRSAPGGMRKIAVIAAAFIGVAIAAVGLAKYGSALLPNAGVAEQTQATAEAAKDAAARKAAAEAEKEAEAERQEAALRREEAARQQAAESAVAEAARRVGVAVAQPFVAEAARREAASAAAAEAVQQEARLEGAFEAAREEAARAVVTEKARRAAAASLAEQEAKAAAQRREAARKAAEKEKEAKRRAALAARREAEQRASSASQSAPPSQPALAPAPPSPAPSAPAPAEDYCQGRSIFSCWQQHR
ncbi:MAG TPA: serine/threonine-protein kinase [Stellaceae bacterium]|nr:serine/threonine-protein kinase [Stellaceae bacterium]